MWPELKQRDVRNLFIWAAGAMAVIALNSLRFPAWLWILTAILFALMAVFLRRIWSTGRGRVGIAATGLIYVVLLVWIASVRPVVIYYNGRPLESQVVKLQSIGDRTRYQSRMYIDSTLGLVAIVGISAKNRGPEPVQIEGALLSFSSQIQPTPQNGAWQRPAEEVVPDGWTGYQTGFGLYSIGTGHSLQVPDFYGAPVPTKRIAVKLSVYHGSQVETAEFTIEPCLTAVCHTSESEAGRTPFGPLGCAIPLDVDRSLFVPANSRLRLGCGGQAFAGDFISLGGRPPFRGSWRLASGPRV